MPWIDSTEIVPSARLATKARSPLGLIATPEGCLPTRTVPITFGGFAFRSTTKTLSSGSNRWPQPWITGISELATRAMSPDGTIARLTGGPTTELINGIVAAMRGAAGLEMSITDRLSWPGSRMIGLKS